MTDTLISPPRCEDGDGLRYKNHRKNAHPHIDNKKAVDIDGKKNLYYNNNNNNNNNIIKAEQLASVDDINDDRTEIQRFYSGTSILVTGATGFMGKVLIEKLLRSCPDITSIYMMVREKKGRNMDERIDDLTSSPCFERIKTEYPKFRSKLYAVAGDIGLEGLGISESDRNTLAQQVNVVFHVAATVRFDEQMTTAILQNVRGTREILNMSRTFKKLKSFIHISTAYANCPSLQIDERFYDPPITSEQAIQIAESLDNTMMDHLTPKLLGKWPNSYAFTKAVSEDAVKKFGQGLPAGVFRPAIVICTKSEPMPGWIDNMYGPSGVIAGVTSGLLRTMHGDDTTEANVVPCDMTISAVIAAAWDVAENRTSKEIPFYNHVAPADNPVTWQRYNEMYFHYGQSWPTSRAIWYWSMTATPYRAVYLVYRLFLHFLPALIMDTFLLVTNKPTQMIRVYQKIHKFVDVIAYFAMTQWRFEDKNVVHLWKKLSPRDRELFNFDMRSLDWERYIRDSCAGVRKYLLKDPPETLPAARKRMQRLYWLHRLVQFLTAVLFIWLSLLTLSSILTPSSTASHLNIVDTDMHLPKQKLATG